jgi:hypothetical protein
MAEVHEHQQLVQKQLCCISKIRKTPNLTLPHCQDFRLKVHNQILTPSKYLTYLGVRFISTNQSRALSLDLVAPAQEIRRRAAVMKRLHRYHFPQNIMRNFVSAFCLGKLPYFPPLLGDEIHHKQTLDLLVKALNACLGTELDAVPTTPIPLLYAGTKRPQLQYMIKEMLLNLSLVALLVKPPGKRICCLGWLR